MLYFSAQHPAQGPSTALVVLRFGPDDRFGELLRALRLARPSTRFVLFSGSTSR